MAKTAPDGKTSGAVFALYGSGMPPERPGRGLSKNMQGSACRTVCAEASRVLQFYCMQRIPLKEPTKKAQTLQKGNF